MNTDRRGTTTALARRTVVLGSTAIVWLALLGCSAASTANDTADEEPNSTDLGAEKAMLVFRDPSCGCCHAWAEIARKAGYHVELRDHQDMPGLKRRLGVPDELSSCHTAQIAGMVIEGHVPLEDVARLIEQRPVRVKGIAVAGMPLGSPGMEVPDGTKQPFKVMAFDAAGKVTEFGA
jgi:hypothetical protein